MGDKYHFNLPGSLIHLIHIITGLWFIYFGYFNIKIILFIINYTIEISRNNIIIIFCNYII